MYAAVVILSLIHIKLSVGAKWRKIALTLERKIVESYWIYGYGMKQVNYGGRIHHNDSDMGNISLKIS
ncbi:MAG: hypothetical protein CVU54_19065 [Deltaproteobacteria bacterium HGW-Deltaproteobacteria-12]|jgi:hypothetical protein|nr:MAG: hypothetical protein CVU54_19065 [Deltaproteobacteria bacterium HGW-Deltaproteobacteria-12]